MAKTSQKTKNKMRRQIIDFSMANGLLIHPGKGFEYYVDNFYEGGGHCPCDAGRPECPCPESIQEVKEKGWCKCRLFWRNGEVYKQSHLKE